MRNLSLQDIVLAPLTRELLEENGRIDAEKGISMLWGWSELAEQLGFDTGRTPAREAYEDGYFKGKKK